MISVRRFPLVAADVYPARRFNSTMPPSNENMNKGMDAHAAIYEACRERFRPIIMTTFAAMMGAIPITLGIGSGGADIGRTPLGYVIVGGLLVSQLLTLFFTPALFLFLEILRERVSKNKKVTKKD